MVNVVVFRRSHPLKALPRLQVSEPDRVHDIQVATEDGDFAALLEFNETSTGNGSDSWVTAAENCQAGDIASKAVAEPGQHRQLLPARGVLKHARPGQDVDRLEARQVSGIVLQSLSNPGANGLSRDAGSLNPKPGFM